MIVRPKANLQLNILTIFSFSLSHSQESNYSDSYFYNSTVFNYPTINDQKKLAKSIADTLEGSNPATSKFHKKKQNLLKQVNEDSQQGGGSYSMHSSGGGYYSGNEYDQEHHMPPQNNFLYDDSLPDIIKRSIAQASMVDPVRMIHAPDSCKQLHYTEHTTHTQMPPKAAMSLAAALETDLSGKGGRGAAIFQKRKAKSEKWVIDESNVKKVSGQQYQPSPPAAPSQPSYQPDFTYEMESPSRTKLVQDDNKQNNPQFWDFNAKPRGWGNYQQG